MNSSEGKQVYHVLHKDLVANLTTLKISSYYYSTNWMRVCDKERMSHYLYYVKLYCTFGFNVVAQLVISGTI